MLDDKATVDLELYVNEATAPQLNSGKDHLDDILVLHLEGGKDLFVSFPLSRFFSMYLSGVK